MRYGSVCSGIEAATVAWECLGWTPSWFAEIEPWPSALLDYRYPETANLGDMTRIAAGILSGDIEAPDVLVGGTPCQAFSIAGLRKSLEDDRGQLSIAYIHLADAIESVRASRGLPPPVTIWENVPGVLSTKDNAFGCFLAGLAGEECELQPSGKKWTDAGCVYGPKRTVAWRVLDAQYFGLAQRRKRVFVVASARADIDPAAILFEFDGLRRDTAPRREAGKVAPTIPSRSTAGGGLGTDFDCDGGLQPVAKYLITKTRLDSETETLIPTYGIPGNWIGRKPENGGNAVEPMHDVAPCLTKADRHGVAHVVGALACNTGPNGHDAGNFACNQAVDAGHVIPVAQPIPVNTMVALRHNALGEGTGFGIGEPGDPAYTLTKGHSHAVAHPIAYGVGESPDLGHCLRSGASKADKHESTTYVAQPVKKDLPLDHYLGGEVTITIDASYAKGCGGTSAAERPVVATGMQVRRLTPVECERLQGFPDDYTLIPWRKKPASECPDGPRYKALGNSMAVPVMRWIGARIDGAVKQ